MSIMHHLDYYKLTMGQVALAHAPKAQVTFTLKNRGENSLAAGFTAEELRWRLARLAQEAFTLSDISWLSTLHFPSHSHDWVFRRVYLDFLSQVKLPEPKVWERNGELFIEATGPWPSVSLWETVVMAELNELYFRKFSISYLTLGHDILSEKIRALRDWDYKIVDFGTRRRFSLNWHRQVVERMASELPNQFVGTSNPGFAKDFDLKPVGTYAHEMPMVYSALAEKDGCNPLIGQEQMLEDWEGFYGPNLLIALTDTFGTDFFLSRFTEAQAGAWQGFRHDSGDPFAFGHKVIDFYKNLGIDPATKTIMYSDGLDLDTIKDIHEKFRGKIGLGYGWGTGLTNDLGLKANNMVMKATEVDGIGTVKLSDVESKYTGTDSQIKKYIDLRAHALTLVN